MIKNKFEYPRHILLTLEQDQWADNESENLGISVGAYFRQLLDDDRKRKELQGSCVPLSHMDRAERRRESIQKPTHDDDVALAIAIAKAIKSTRMNGQ